eukprot:1962395-Pyramimonas_sp.AAC.1
MPARLTLSQSWAAPQRGHSYPVMNGPQNGRTCVIPYARYFYRDTDTLVREDIGSNTEKGMLRLKDL